MGKAAIASWQWAIGCRLRAKEPSKAFSFAVAWVEPQAWATRHLGADAELSILHSRDLGNEARFNGSSIFDKNQDVQTLASISEADADSRSTRSGPTR